MHAPTDHARTTRSSLASIASSSDTFMSSFETPGRTTASAALKVKDQKGGRRRSKMRPALEETDHDQAGTDHRRNPGSFNLIAKTSQAFLQALGDYQQEDGTASAALKVKDQKGGRRRSKMRSALEKSDHDEAGTDPRRHSGSFNLIAKTSQAFLQALGDYQQEDGTAHARPEATCNSPEVVTEDYEETEEEDGVGDEDRDEGESDPMDCSAKAGDCSLTLTSLGARRAWGRLRLHITETAMKNNSKESILGWRFLRLAVSSLSNLEKTRSELYERYLEKPESWTDALVNCPDHLRFRNFKACSAKKVPRVSSGSTIGDNSPRWSSLSARNDAPSHVTGRSSADHVTKTGSVAARTERDLPRTKSAFVRKPQMQSSTRRGESATARIIV